MSTKRMLIEAERETRINWNGPGPGLIQAILQHLPAGVIERGDFSLLRPTDNLKSRGNGIIYMTTSLWAGRRRDPLKRRGRDPPFWRIAPLLSADYLPKPSCKRTATTVAKESES